jgi:hypothetical protein
MPARSDRRSGKVLMQDGIEIVHGTGSRAHVLTLTARD